jgi:hypothetical protein
VGLKYFPVPIGNVVSMDRCCHRMVEFKYGNSF